VEKQMILRAKFMFLVEQEGNLFIFLHFEGAIPILVG
jgi:hypothetical protein